MSVEIALLGEVTARVNGQPVDIGPPRQRCVLAALAVDAGRLVLTERLVGRVWGADTPRRGRATLHSHISRLRGAFAGALTIAHRSDGYTLAVDDVEQAVDLLLFRALCGRARGAGDDARTVSLLTEAMALWRGEPLTGLSGKWVEGERDRWQQERWAAELDLVDARLGAGHGDELVAQLSARAAQYPLDERVAGQYMLALHRAGRAADALEQYRRTRARLVEELGTDPGAALQDLHRQILAADPGLTTGGTVTAPVALPRQLPAAPAPFVGRGDEQEQLDAALSPGRGGLMLISAIGGAGGIGKTWLALRWAHHSLDRFPDGQLFVDLRGFSPTGRPAHPADVLGGFLDALGVDRGRQPADLDRRADLYRSLVADKRMLIVLDNAATTDQVIPLLPGGPHCVVLVTSRHQLRGLVARHGARPLHVDVLTDAEAHTLLATALGPARAAAGAAEIAELIALCGGFPLALGLIAARAATDPRLPLGDIVAELRARGLGALDSEDRTASLPAVLSWSLHHLTHQQHEAFALLGIAPGPNCGLPAAAHLTGLDERETHVTLRALSDASLIEHTPGGRYGMHDLVRAYATTVADDLPVQVREGALRRVTDFYAYTARGAERVLSPHRYPVRLDSPAPDVHPHPLPTEATALAWFDTEHAGLLAAQQTAAAHQWHPTVWNLAWGLYTFHLRRGHRHALVAVWQAGVDAANHLPDLTTRILANQSLGYAQANLGHHEVGVEHLRRALSLAEQVDDPLHQAQTHRALAWVWGRQGDDRQALVYAGRALDFHRFLDEPLGEAAALNTVGWYAAQLGDYDTARDHCQAALVLFRDHHNPDGEAATLDSLGYIDHHSGRHTEAIDHYHHALAVYRAHGNTYEAANTLDDLGHPHAALGEHQQARALWQEAAQLFREQGRHDDATRVQRQLDDLDRPPEPT